MATKKIKMATKYGNSILTEEEVDIEIKGLQNTYKFIHVSDLHITGYSSSDSDETRVLSESRSEFWRNQAGYMCNENTPDEYKLYPMEVNEIVAERIRFHNPDKVFFTGDTVDFPSLTNFKMAKEFFESLDTDYVFAPGNHDIIEDNSSENLKDLFNEITGGCYEFRKIEYGEFNIIAINDGRIEINENQYLMTKKALDTNKKSIILLHAPVYHTEQKDAVWNYWGYNWMIGEEQQSETNRRFLKLLEDNRNKIAAIFAGHVHMALGDNLQNQALLPQYIAAPCFCGYLRVVNIHG